MAISSWARTLGISLGAGLVAGAAQLGVAYGLGILRWDAEFSRDAWHWQLTWLALLTAIAVVAGAVTGRWGAGRFRPPAGLPLTLAVTLSSALGAAVMIPLVLHPSHGAHLSEPGSPTLTAVMTTSVGLILGVLAAVGVLSVPAVAGNVVANVTWFWLAALGSALWTIGQGAAWGTARPGLLPASGAWIPLVLLGVPGLIALAVAAVARFGGSTPPRVAVSGMPGPALLAAAYVIGAPGGGPESSAYQYALIAVAVCGAISVLVAAARPLRLPARPSRPEPAPAPRPADEPRVGAHRLPAWTDAPDEDWPGPSAAASAPAAPADADADATTVDLPAKNGDDAPAEDTEPAKDKETPKDKETAKDEAPVKDEAPADEKPARRRGRRRDSAQQPVPASDSDYVDWVKALGGGGSTKSQA